MNVYVYLQWGRRNFAVALPDFLVVSVLDAILKFLVVAILNSLRFAILLESLQQNVGTLQKKEGVDIYLNNRLKETKVTI